MSDELVRAQQRGFGKRVSFGERPALLVVDFSRAFTDPAHSLGADVTAQIGEANRLLDAAHAAGIPVYLSTIAYRDPATESRVWGEKIDGLRDLVLGSEAVAQDPRLARAPSDNILVKRFASCFFGTPLAEDLAREGVDTLIIAGCTTSGCVRASAVDACQHGLRAIVAREATADRFEAAHQQSLTDIEVKYGDVLPVTEIVAVLRDLPQRARRAG
ncbi:isochorismatase family protein [Chelatococcus sp. GCM10030263]|uniref:isochorismatase family protein n=1 Tax=Chelatococcus sp. GCM10030263 TaxID=3273387 RepID=UPI00360D994E